MEEIEQDISELCEILRDTSELLKRQDDSLNMISDHTSNVESQTQQAKEEFTDANKKMMSHRKTKLLVMTVIGIGGGMILPQLFGIKIGMVAAGTVFAITKTYID